MTWSPRIWREWSQDGLPTCPSDRACTNGTHGDRNDYLMIHWTACCLVHAGNFPRFSLQTSFPTWQKDTNILGNYNCFRSKRKEYYTIRMKNFRGYINQSNFLFQISRRSWEYNFWKFCFPSLAFMSTSCSRCALMFLCSSMFTLYRGHLKDISVMKFIMVACVTLEHNVMAASYLRYFIDTAKNSTGLYTKFWLFVSIKFPPCFYFKLILISALIPGNLIFCYLILLSNYLILY